MTYRIRADIRYIEGVLEGVVITSGFSVPMPDLAHANRMARWVERCIKQDEFVRATGTGRRYEFVSYPTVSPVEG